MEVAGFSIRILGHKSPCSDNSEIVQKIFILVAPSIFAATIYMILGRTILAIHAAKISPTWLSRLTKIFVAGDVACFCIQLAGAAIMSGGGSNINSGRYIILASLGLQMVLFSVFVFVAFIFHSRIRKQPTEAFHRPEIHWEVMLFVLYGVSSLIMLRSLFRMIETAGGRNGYLLSHEWPLYVFDSVLMAAVMAVLLHYFPILIRPRTLYAMDTIEAQPVLARSRCKKYKSVHAPSPSPSDNRH